MFFTETLLKSFNFLEVVREKPKESKTISTKKKDFVSVFKKVKQHLEGKKKLKTADHFLKEL